MKYNLGKFNVATNVISIRGQSALELQSSIQIEVERRGSGQAALALAANVVHGIEYSGAGQVAMAMAASIHYDVERSGIGHADLAINADLDWTVEQPGSGQTSMAMDAVLQKYEVERRAEGGAMLTLSTNKAVWTVERYGTASVGMAMSTVSDPTRLKYAPGADILPMTLRASGITNLLGVDSIHLVLDLQPGDELELDMCELTAMLNNENAMKYLASDGNFFDFPAGNNEIIVAITPTDVPIEGDIYWKDRWL